MVWSLTKYSLSHKTSPMELAQRHIGLVAPSSKHVSTLRPLTYTHQSGNQPYVPKQNVQQAGLAHEAPAQKLGLVGSGLGLRTVVARHQVLPKVLVSKSWLGAEGLENSQHCVQGFVCEISA